MRMQKGKSCLKEGVSWSECELCSCSGDFTCWSDPILGDEDAGRKILLEEV